MGVAYYIALDLNEEERADIDTFVDGKSFARQLEPLTELVAQLGLEPIDHWVSISDEELDSLLDLDDEDDEEADESEEADEDGSDEEADPEALAALENNEVRWFTAEAGLAYFNALAHHLRAHPNAVPDAQDVLSDVEGYIAVLTQAQAVKAQWYLAIDY